MRILIIVKAIFGAFRRDHLNRNTHKGFSARHTYTITYQDGHDKMHQRWFYNYKSLYYLYLCYLYYDILVHFVVIILVRYSISMRRRKIFMCITIKMVTTKCTKDGFYYYENLYYLYVYWLCYEYLGAFCRDHLGAL